MMVGFIIWSSVALLISAFGICAWRAKKPAGFYTGSESPKVKNVTRYNHAVAVLWFSYAALFELSGIPFLYQEQNSPAFILTMLVVVFITIALMIAYNRILSVYQQD